MHLVGIDNSAVSGDFKAHAQRGAGRYVRELSNFITRSDHAKIKTFKFGQNELKSPALLERLIKLAPFGRTTLRQQLLFPFRLSRAPFNTADLIHFPAHIDAPAWSPKPYAVTVLDLIPIVLSELYGGTNGNWRFKLARKLELQAIKNASLIMAISEHSARDVARILNIPLEKIFVTPLGVDLSFLKAKDHDPVAFINRFQLPEERPLVSYVGGIDQRKNIPFLLEAFSALLKKRSAENKALPMLILAGNIKTDREYPKLEKLLAKLSLTDDVFLSGYIEDSILLELFSASAAFCFPSLYEGFGLPPLEAMAAGVPVVSSNSSAMPEVLGEAALSFDPSKQNEMIQALDLVLSDKSLAETLAAKGPEQARKFSWENTARLTLKAYESYFINKSTSQN